jgi:hypothetical protein
LIAVLNIKIPINRLSQDYFIEGYQATKRTERCDDIFLVNIRDYPTDVIRDQIEILSHYGPATIIVDYFPDDCFFSDSTTLINYEDIVLPILRDPVKGDAIKSKNCYSTTAYYGSPTLYSTSFFEPFVNINGTRYPFVALKATELIDQTAYHRFVNRQSDKEVIDYCGNVTSFNYLGDLLDTSESELQSVKDKIVIVGYLGGDVEHDHDIHITPIGKMYGAVIIANIIKTILDQKLSPFERYWQILATLIFILVNVTVVLKMKQSLPTYLVIKMLQVVQVLIIFAFFSYIMHQNGTWINVELLNWSVLVVPEITFWISRLIRLTDDGIAI